MNKSHYPILKRLLWSTIFIFTISGCALHYYEEKTGVEHIWGFGHMKMKAAKPNEGLQAVVHGTDVIGLSVGKVDQNSYLTLGWQRLEFIDVLKESTSIRLEGPNNTFSNIRVGAKFPSNFFEQSPVQKEKGP